MHLVGNLDRDRAFEDLKRVVEVDAGAEGGGVAVAVEEVGRAVLQGDGRRRERVAGAQGEEVFDEPVFGAEVDREGVGELGLFALAVGVEALAEDVLQHLHVAIEVELDVDRGIGRPRPESEARFQGEEQGIDHAPLRAEAEDVRRVVDGARDDEVDDGELFAAVAQVTHHAEDGRQLVIDLQFAAVAEAKAQADGVEVEREAGQRGDRRGHVGAEGARVEDEFDGVELEIDGARDAAEHLQADTQGEPVGDAHAERGGDGDSVVARVVQIPVGRVGIDRVGAEHHVGGQVDADAEGEAVFDLAAKGEDKAERPAEGVVRVDGLEGPRVAFERFCLKVVVEPVERGADGGLLLEGEQGGVEVGGGVVVGRGGLGASHAHAARFEAVDIEGVGAGDARDGGEDQDGQQGEWANKGGEWAAEGWTARVHQKLLVEERGNRRRKTRADGQWALNRERVGEVGALAPETMAGSRSNSWREALFDAPTGTRWASRKIGPGQKGAPP